ncbi:unnamed protein product [Citrullus colocynthis]|uniref:Uncharacterized protein n=1 Tax=Citrullus colocynthis TaxID=252529 RepID=A0ABP0Z3J6_9ROSI
MLSTPHNFSLHLLAKHLEIANPSSPLTFKTQLTLLPILTNPLCKFQFPIGKPTHITHGAPKTKKKEATTTTTMTTIVNSAKVPTTSRKVMIVSMTTIVVATVSIVVVLLPMGAEAHIPTVGPIAQCIQGCTKSLSSLTPGYCLSICGAEYRPLTTRHREISAPHHHHDHNHVDKHGIIADVIIPS